MRTKIRVFIAFQVLPFLAHQPVSADTHTAPPATLDWQEKMLLYPTPGHLSAEQDGRITIYDSLEFSLIDEALDLHFDRMRI